ncbi:Protein kinase C-binding protein NELL1 [Microtus ochrogaster]|uniref:Protein kinase C-binding protein NELL1 n=1 Tax=Microtus ochrogaster TaxID=79684 RepID=A0A8J6GUU3_MICOH|nr:Protein kinase C-binding protein NELL1 [Microtus ochrogaster]
MLCASTVDGKAGNGSSIISDWTSLGAAQLCMRCASTVDGKAGDGSSIISDWTSRGAAHLCIYCASTVDGKADIEECALRTHTCWNDSACVNLVGGFDCLCPAGPSCSGDCPHEGGLKHNGQVWILREDRCSVCSCKDGKIFCRRTACDCQNPNVDLFCCPECETRVTSQCLDQSGHKLYRSGDNWTHSCQQCRCLEGEADCWPLACPSLSCEYTAIFEGECCPRCVSDPCLADNIVYDIQKTCLDSSGVSRLNGAVWTMAGSPCTSCKCKAWESSLILMSWDVLQAVKYIRCPVPGRGFFITCLLTVALDG